MNALHAAGLLFISGALSLALGTAGFARLATATSALLTLVAAAIGLSAAGDVLLGGRTWTATLDVALAGGRLRVGVDPLSAVFLLPIFVVGPLSAAYAHGYLAKHEGRLGGHLAFFSWLLACMALVVIARDTVVFIFAWELMTLLTFFLVALDDGEPEVRRAAFLYVTISHIAAMFVIAFFLLLGARCGSTDLARIAEHAGGWDGAARVALLLLALVGFGTKAGLAPLHVWLPRAHPAAPSHVSALMSAVVVKTAVYGLLRATSLVGPPPGWWGYLLLGLGALTGVGGILFGVAQRDLKRLLAYSTVENVGVVLIGVGVGALGTAHGHPVVAVLGYTGALMHALHHAVMKALLFMGAGSFLHATHLRSLDGLGGLLRRMPLTSGSFLTGALAISAAPGLCGFASEFLIYCALVRAALELPPIAGAAALGGALALATIGGLAAAAFTKAAGVALLGEPRSSAADGATESSPAMTVPMLLLAGCALALGVAPALLAQVVAPVAATLAGIAPEAARGAVHDSVALLSPVTRVAAALLVSIAAIAAGRALLLRARSVTAGPTWGCGYGAPSRRMQYTATSFSGALTDAARLALRPRVEHAPVDGYFPAPTSRTTVIEDPAERYLFEAGARRVRDRLLSLRWMQLGRLQLYLLYILLAVVALLTWDMIHGGLGQ